MSIFSLLILLLGLVLLMCALSDQLGLGKLVAIIGVGIVLAVGLGNWGGLPPSQQVSDAILSPTMLSQIMLIAGCGLCFSLGLQLQPLSLFKLRQHGWLWPMLEWLILTLLFMGVLWFSGLQGWITLFTVSSVCALGSFVLYSAQFQEQAAIPASLKQQFRTQYWRQPSLQAQGLIFVLLFLALPILQSPTQPIRYLAEIMAMVALLSGGLLAVRYTLNPLCAYFQMRQASLVHVCLVVFIMSFMYLGYALGVHLLITALLCGMVMTQSRNAQALLQCIQRYHPWILIALFIPLCLEINGAYVAEIGMTVLLLSLIFITLKWCISFIMSYVQTRQWQEATIRAFDRIHLSEWAALIVLFASPSLFLSPISVSTNATLTSTTSIPLEQWLFMGIVLSLLLQALLKRIFSACIEPHFPHLKFKPSQLEDRSMSSATKPKAVILIGFSEVGHVIARALHLHQQPFYVMDQRDLDLMALHFDRVQFIYADATQPHELEQLPLQTSSHVILCLSQIQDSLQVATYLSAHYPHLQLHVRAAQRAHVRQLKALGIAFVWSSHLSSALDMADVLLDQLGKDVRAISGNDALAEAQREDDVAFFSPTQFQLCSTTAQYNTPLAELKWLYITDVVRP